MNHYKESLLKIISQHAPQAKVYLYGSRARNTHAEGADIDVALDVGKKIDPKVILQILSDIDDSLIPVFVDVVDFYSINEKMKNEIIKDRIIWKN